MLQIIVNLNNVKIMNNDRKRVCSPFKYKNNDDMNCFITLEKIILN